MDSTFRKINHELNDKEFCLQFTKRGYRCISWHPHYIMTDWVKTKEQAILDSDNAIEEFYNRMEKAGEAFRIVYDRMIAEKEKNVNN